MAMTYDAFLGQKKKDLEAGLAEDLPAKYSQVKIRSRDVEKLNPIAAFPSVWEMRRLGDVFFGYGIILLYLLTIIPHELLHAMCFQGDVYLYHDLRHGMVFIVGPERMSKCRFIIKSLLPGFVLGVIPYISFLINPELRTLGLLGTLGIASSAGDYYNVYNALGQMPKGARAYMHKYNTFWYIPDSKRFD